MTEPHDPRTPQERAYALDESHGGTPPDESQQGPTQAQESTAPDDTRVLHTDDPTAAYGTPVSNPTLVYPEPGPPSAMPQAAPNSQADQQTQAYPAQPHSPGQGYPPAGAAPVGYQPTQQFGPTQQYGPAQQYQPTQQFEPIQQPTAGYQAAQGYQPTQAFGQPPNQPPGYPPTMPPEGPPGADGSKKAPRGPRWGILLLAVVVLIALGGTIGFLVSKIDGESDSATGARQFTTQAPAAPLSPSPSPEESPSIPPLDELPGGLGEIIGDSGAVVGTVTSNDGSSLTISGIGGSLVTVLLTPDTQIITLSGDDPSALTVGSAVVATGTPVEAGSMTAETVVSASIPSFDGPGR